MSNVLVLRKQDPVQATMGSQGFQPQINLTGGNNIPYNQYLPSWAGGSQYDPNAGYTGARPDITTTGEGDNASYGIGTNQYGTKEEAEAAHGAAPKYNLTTGQKIMGGTAAALPAAWSMLHSLSDDSQGDLFSAAGRGAMSGIAARSAANSAGLESGALSAGAKLDPALAHLGQKWTNWRDSIAGSTSDKVGEDNVDAALGIQSNNDPQQTNLNQYGMFTNPMHEKSKQITAEEAQKDGEQSMEIAEPPVSAAEIAAVDTGQKIMGENKRQLTLDEATRMATGDTKNAMFKSRRPWSYY